MPKVSDEHRQLMVQRIEKAAMECARRDGFAAMSMADIISESGLSAGAIYGYYKSKDELLAALARRVVAGRVAMLDDLASRSPVPDPADGIQEFIGLMTGPLRDNGLVVQVWGMSSNSDAISKIVQDSYGQLIEHMEAYLAAWYQEARGESLEEARVSAASIALAVISLVHGWMFQISVAGKSDDRQYLDAVATLLRQL